MSDPRPICEIMDPDAWRNLGTCPHCEEPILQTDERRPILVGTLNIDTGDVDAKTMWVHSECMFRQVTGGVAHIEERCSCYVQGGPDDTDPPGMTPREAARAAVAAWRSRKSN